jgi:hypothetical protein
MKSLCAGTGAVLCALIIAACATDDPSTVAGGPPDVPPAGDSGTMDPGSPEATSGVVELSSDTPALGPDTVRNVGGGTWNFGHNLGHCWSHYVHPARRHSATAVCGPVNPKVYANAGTWANSDVNNCFQTCSVYWNTY